MAMETPWSNTKRIARLSRDVYGTKLAQLVAKKLSADKGEKGIWNRHRDWCGHGLLCMDGEFLLVEVSDGMPWDGPVLRRWPDESEFISWLAHQSDYSCSGADESIPEFKARSQFDLNNQRLTRSRLTAYVAIEQALPMFRQFLDAALEEFAFLPQDYEFPLTQSTQVGREYVVSYGKSGVGGVSIHYEPFSSILLTVSWIKDGEEIWTNAVLDSVAKERIPTWQKPAINYDDPFPNYRGYLKDYAFMLQRNFQDFLRTGSPEWEQELHKTLERDVTKAINADEHAYGDSLEDHSPPAERERPLSPRIWGAAIMAASFAAMIVELRWFIATGSPEPTGSPRANYGILLLMSIPWLTMAVGTLQALSNVDIRAYVGQFQGLKLLKKIGISFTMITVLVLATVMAVIVSTNF